jgi:hypothetical protein
MIGERSAHDCIKFVGTKNKIMAGMLATSSSIPPNENALLGKFQLSTHKNVFHSQHSKMLYTKQPFSTGSHSLHILWNAWYKGVFFGQFLNNKFGFY